MGPPYSTAMTGISHTKTARDTEVRFWALFAVVMSLLTQAVFPPQAVAAAGEHGAEFVLCFAGLDSAPVADPIAAKLFAAHHKGLAGLKCVNCLVASVTAVTPPPALAQHAVYIVGHADFRPAAVFATVGARAPPRPFSCGPPSSANARV